MINVSTAFKEALEDDNRNFSGSCTITLNGTGRSTSVNVDSSQLWDNGFVVDDSTSNTGGFDIGSAIVQKFTLRLNNMYDDFTECDFTGAVISNVKVSLDLGDKQESVSKGIFTVNDTSYDGDIITLECLDNMHKFDISYEKSNLTYPATLLQIVQDACRCCGVTLATDSLQFEYYNYVIQEKPDDNTMTFRDVLTWVGQISGHFWKCNKSGQLSAGWYNMSDLSAGKNIHTLQTNVVTDVNVDMDDVVITCVRIVTEDENSNQVTFQSGSDGYAVVIDSNKFINKGNAAEIASMVGGRVVGLRFRPMTVSSLQDPTIEAGDGAIVYDRKLKSYKTFFTNVVFSIDADNQMSNDAESALRNSAERFSEASKIYQDLKKHLNKNKTEWEKAMEELEKAMKEQVGLYPVIKTLDDGSKVYYMCDHQTLEESQVVFELNGKGWAVSTDGGKTWNAGLLVDGTMITKILDSIGINADWINTGAFTVLDSDGNIMFKADTATGRVDIVANSFQLRGKTLEEIAKGVTKDYVDSVIGDVVKDLNTQYFNSYDPTLTNKPASEWTDTTTKDKHLDDIFYNTNTKKMFRFVKINGVYSWENFDNPDIKTALDAASTAQDTADGKRRVFTVTPFPPYDKGDLWVTSIDGKGEIKTCKTSKKSGTYSSSDWIGLSYVDSDDVDSAIIEYDTSLGQSEIFNKLTNNGKNKGIYIQNGELYINASYILSGVLAGKFINAKGMKVIDKDNQTTLYVDDSGKVHILATEFSLQGKSVSDIATDAATEEAKKYKTLNVTLSNEYQGIPTDSAGNYTTFPNCKTTVTVLYGNENVTNSASITFTAGNGVTGSKSGATYTVTALSTDTGIITVSVSYNNLSVEKQFTIVKQKQGIQGLQGIQGTDGKNGISGKDGKDGKTSYFHIKYSSVANPNSSSQMTETPNTYIGTYVDYTESDSNDPTKYTWSRFEGKDGAQGIPGTNGNNGQTSYLHIAYATSSDGKTGFSVSDSTGKTYIGQYTDFKKDDSTNPSDYSWTKIKGDTGNGVSVITQHYLASSSSSGVTTSTVGWTETVQIPTSSKRYLWNYQTTTYTDKTTVNTTPHVIGVYGESGKDGKDGKDASDMTQLEIFNKLTNNGQTQGIYLYNQKLYINADYIDTGTLAGWEIDSANKVIRSKGTKYGGAVELDGENGTIYAKSNLTYVVPTIGNVYGTSIKGATIETGRVYATDTVTSSVTTNDVSTATVSATQAITAGSTITAEGIIKSNSHIEARDNGHFYCEGTGTDLADASIRGELKVAGVTHLNGTGVQMRYISAGTGTDLVLSSISFTGGGHVLKKASSSKRYKKHLSFMEDSDVENLYNLRPVFFEYKEGYLMDDDPDNKRSIPGFYAELVEKYFPDAVRYNEKGQVEDWDVKKMVPAILKLVQNQNERINTLEDTVNTLNERLNKLEEMLKGVVK